MCVCARMFGCMCMCVLSEDNLKELVFALCLVDPGIRFISASLFNRHLSLLSYLAGLPPCLRRQGPSLAWSSLGRCFSHCCVAVKRL